MKKVLGFTILAITLITALILVGIYMNNNKYLKEISYSQLEKKIKNKETFILEVMQDGCQYCSIFKPRFEAVLKENKVQAYKINFTKMSEKEIEQFKSEFGSVKTPTVIFFEKGKEKTSLNRIVGAVNKDHIVTKLKSNGYIK